MKQKETQRKNTEKNEKQIHLMDVHPIRQRKLFRKERAINVQRAF